MNTNAHTNDFSLSTDEVNDFCAFIGAHETFLITGHKECDGDCICSCLALSELLERMGKKTVLLSAGPFPFKRPEIKKFEGFFVSSIEAAFKTEKCNGGGDIGADSITGGTDSRAPNAFFTAEGVCNKSCGLFMVDCSTFDRVGEIGIKEGMFDTFIIDHHKTAEINGKNRIIKPAAPAACYVVQLLYEAIHEDVSEKAARVLFLGLSTDTGYFRFLESDSASVFEAASRLVQKGANPKETYNEITGHKPFSARKLLARQLESARLFYGGKLIAVYQTRADDELYGAHGKDSDSLYQLLLSVEGVEAVISMKAESETQCTVGLRSKTDVDVSVIASRFGGGGHKNASGLSAQGSIDELLPKLVAAFAEAFSPLEA